MDGENMNEDDDSTLTSFDYKVHADEQHRLKALARMYSRRESPAPSHLAQLEGNVAAGMASLSVNRSRQASFGSDGPEDQLSCEADESEGDGLPLNDVRRDLFVSIPEPYPHSESFQRVVITQDSAVDEDTKLACSLLKQCKALREKWQGFHPFPTQDLAVFERVDSFGPRESTYNPRESMALCESSYAGGYSRDSMIADMQPGAVSPGKRKVQFRRRADPDYSIFDREIPQPITDMFTYKMRKGVMSVYDSDSSRIDADGSVSESSNPSSNQPLQVSKSVTQQAMEGWVDKMGRSFTHSWRRRYLVLNGPLLRYYGDDSKSEKELKGEYLISVDTALASDSTNLKFSLAGSSGDFHLAVNDKGSFTKWVEAISSVLDSFSRNSLGRQSDKLRASSDGRNRAQSRSQRPDSDDEEEDHAEGPMGANGSNGKSAAAAGDGAIRGEAVNRFPVPSFADFIKDFNFVKKTAFTGAATSYSHKRLEVLSAKFNLHVLLNSDKESEAQKSVPHRDFYNVRKVDTHIHHSASMNQKHLLRFIKHKLKTTPDEVVIEREGQMLTLGQVFKSLKLTAYDLSIDTLDMHANNTFHRFDRFNLKYNPAGQSRLRDIFLKTDNYIGGRYLAEITREMFTDLEASKYQLVEWRISIYGRKESEWRKLADWFYTHKLAHNNIRWMIQVPRLYHLYKSSGEVQNFEELLSNIFSPLFAVSIDPTSNPSLHLLLETVVGFDSVDDESRPERQVNLSLPEPRQWNEPENPPYSYWMYYMYANICVLNQLRAARGLSTFTFRPHCGEAGDIDRHFSNYLLAHHINHGIVLRKNSVIHYLYYLSQIGIAMSPLSNNKLFLDYNKNPFPKYFRQGLNVSLSTDDPLMLHYTKDPLVEEYSVATQVWKLSSTDQCEIARNSVLQSGWEDLFKKHYLGKNYEDIRETNVPLIRLNYRRETLQTELSDIDSAAEGFEMPSRW